MQEKLRKLYNALMTIETRGSNTIVLADCLRYTEQLIAEAAAAEQREGGTEQNG